jgi:hypothetical protein
VGNDQGGDFLSPAVRAQPTTQRFQPHLLTSGVFTLEEGRTISYPESSAAGKGLTTLATSSHGRPITMYRDAAENRGRILVDGGYTKFFEINEQTKKPREGVRCVGVARAP